MGLDGTPYATLVRRVWPSTTTSTDATAATPGTTCKRPSVLPVVAGPEGSSEQAAAVSKAGSSHKVRAFMRGSHLEWRLVLSILETPGALGASPPAGKLQAGCWVVVLG